MSHKPKLYFSYAPDAHMYEKLEFLEKIFAHYNDDQFDVLVDKKLDASSAQNTFASQKDYCFGAVLLLTPAYKEQILLGRGRVFTEYTGIMDTQSKRNGEFYIYPLLLEGSQEQSLPDEIKIEDCCVLTMMQVMKGVLVKDQIYRSYIILLYKTIQHARSNAPFENAFFYGERDKVRQVLFEEPKADFNNPDNQALIDQIIVKNNALQKVNDCESLIIIGRKGSGKSTLTQVVPHIYRNKFSGGIPVNANMLELDNIFANITVLKNPEYPISDKVILKRKDLLKAGWKYFIHLMFIDAMLKLKAQNGKSYVEPDEQEVLLRYFRRFYEEYDTRSLHTSKPTEARYNELTRILFPYAMTRVADFIEETQNRLEAAANVDIAAWNSYYTEDRFFASCFNSEMMSILRNCTQRLSYSDKKILFTLDNFDNTFYDERRSIVNSIEFNPSVKQDELIKRASKDSDLLYSLIQIVYQPNKEQESHDFILSAFNFCITIPADLYLDIERLYRDSYIFINKEQTLTWTGLELMALLYKRVARYLGIPTSTPDTREKYYRQDKSLTELFQQHFPDIPTHVTVEFNNVECEVPLFSYILRHTFWRPREIIIFYANIISTHNTIKEMGLQITSKDIKILVKKWGRVIIEREYLTEFDTHCLNIEDIIGRFKGKTQILTYEELQETLGNVIFQFTSQSHNKDDKNRFVEKISLLYQIGFLGIIISPRKAAEDSLHKYCFIFNAGLDVFYKNRRPDEQDIKHHTYIIHPIFFEYLSLSNRLNEEFVLNFSFDYLQEQYKVFTMFYN